MNAMIRTTVIAFVMGLLAFGIFCFHMTCSLLGSSESRVRAEELRQLEQATFARAEARQQAAQEWISQRRTLAETMRRYKELEHQWPDYVTPQREYLLPDEERHYGIILVHVGLILEERPKELAAARRRLEKEYQQYQADRQTSSPSARRTADRMSD